MPHFLNAGPVQVRYENGFLRYLSVDSAEIVRMIYFAVRDQNWRTTTLTFTNEVITQNNNSFRIEYDWQTDELGIQMDGHVRIEGDAAGTIAVDFHGKALNTFLKNRIGICVLHPIEGVLGQPVQLVAPDGSLTDSYFSTFISPHQPFLNIQTMRWRPTSGTTWQLDFSGDIFETEDQRNWTDMSFKTYSTPVDLPKPALVSAGEEIRQRVVFGMAKEALSASANEQKIRAMEQFRSAVTPTHLRSGVGQRTGGPPLTAAEAALLRQLNLSHLRADVFFSLPNWQGLLGNAITDAQQLAISLELALFFGNNSEQELQSLQTFLADQPVRIQSVLLFNAATLRTTDDLLQVVIPLVRKAWPGVLIGGGTDDNFAELNRNPFDVELVDFVTYSMNPQAHAFDDLTLLENIPGQAETALSARKLAGGKPIHVSPITLRSRYITVVGTATERQQTPADPRQTTDFGADWTRQSLAVLAQAGVESVTYYQSHGPGGLVSGNIAYPVFDVFNNTK